MEAIITEKRGIGRIATFVAMALLAVGAILGAGATKALAAGYSTLEVDGLDEGDVVTFYKVAKYENGTGYHFLAGLGDDGNDQKMTLGDSDSITLPGSADIKDWGADKAFDSARANAILGKAVTATGIEKTAVPAVKDGDSYKAILDVNARGMWAVTVKNGASVKKVYQNMIVAVNKANEDKTQKITAKSNPVTITKTTDDAITGSDQDVSFTIHTTGVQYNADSTGRTYTIVDTLPAGLTFKSVDSIKMGTVTFVKDTDYTVTTDGQKVTIKFTDAGIKQLRNNETVETKLTAHRDASHHGRLVNDAVLNYSDDSYTDNVTPSTDDKSPLYDITLDLTKVDGASKAALPGAVFTLQKDGKYVKADGSLSETEVKLTVTKDGKLTVKGLDEGTYTLTEVTAPDGYIITDSPITFTIEATVDTSKNNTPDATKQQLKEIKVTNVSAGSKDTGSVETAGLMDINATGISNTDGTESVVTANVYNTKQGTLPGLGADGTVAVIVIGAGLCVAALGVAKARKDAADKA